MLTVLSMFGGRTISKYVIIAGAVAAIAFGMWLAVQSYNKAIAGKATAEAASAAKTLKIKQANAETEAANDNIRRLKKISESQQRQVEQARRLAHDRAISRQQATVALAGYLNSNSSADINRMLCEAAARIQGGPVAGCGEEMLVTGAASSGSDHAASYVITNSTVEAIHSALNQCGDYIELLERNSIPDKTAKDNGEPQG